MKLLRQLGIIFAFGFAGEILALAMPVTVPASVLGLLLLLAAIRAGLLRTQWIGDAAGFLSANMAFFFLPSAVNILQNYSQVRSVLWQLLVICTVSTVLTFIVSYFVARLIGLLLHKRRRS